MCAVNLWTIALKYLTIHQLCQVWATYHAEKVTFGCRSLVVCRTRALYKVDQHMFWLSRANGQPKFRTLHAIILGLYIVSSFTIWKIYAKNKYLANKNTPIVQKDFYDINKSNKHLICGRFVNSVHKIERNKKVWQIGT